MAVVSRVWLLAYPTLTPRSKRALRSTSALFGGARSDRFGSFCKPVADLQQKRRQLAPLVTGDMPNALFEAQVMRHHHFAQPTPHRGALAARACCVCRWDCPWRQLWMRPLPPHSLLCKGRRKVPLRVHFYQPATLIGAAFAAAL